MKPGNTGIGVNFGSEGGSQAGTQIKYNSFVGEKKDVPNKIFGGVKRGRRKGNGKRGNENEGGDQC